MKQVDLSKLKVEILEKINDQYNSIDDFLSTDFGKSLGKNVKTYLYPSGAVSFPILCKLTEHLGMGKLDKKTIVTRTVKYTITEKVRHARVTKKPLRTEL